ATPAAPAQPAQPAVPLHRAAHTVGQLLQVAHDRGVTHARLALKPADLGGIEIRLQTSSAGVTAQVIADSPEATRLLQQAGSELRRSLEDAGVNLLSLDVSTHGEDRSAAAMDGFAAHAEARERDRHLNGSERGRSRSSRAPAVEDQPTRARTLELPGRVLVDVLA
ncbi:MAG: flagellar hook-length control protein FliK, partial [Actinomycetota bacterium]|nr:flagellar hook-length control protein FliK [Actinomycetota bacterium]